MKAETWVWYPFNQDYPGAAGVNDDTQLPIGRVWLKTHERSLFYTAQRLTEIIRIYEAQDIEMGAWCVPTGLADDAGLAISVLNTMHDAGIAEPWLQLDVEVEPGNFWQGTPAQLRQTFIAIRQACPWANLALCVYQYDNALYGIDTVAPMADLLVSMSYWNDFGTQPEAQLAFDYQHLSFYGRPVQLGLPGNAPPAEFARALVWVRDHGGQSIVWRRGTTSAANWQQMAAFVMELEPPPKPEPEPEPVPCPPLSEEWLLRVGVGQQLMSAATIALDGGMSSAAAFATVRQTAAGVLTTIDKAGAP